MVDSYLRALGLVLESSRLDAALSASIECKHFFSGAAAYVDGRIFVTMTPTGLALKVRPSDRAALLERGATPLRYFPKAPLKKDYVVIPESITDDEAALREWIDASIEFCRSLPLPRKSPRAGSSRRAR